MILVLNGPLGVGKTETSWALLKRFNRAVMLDADYVAAVHPSDYREPAHFDYLVATLRHLVAYHQANGYQDFVVNWVFETPEQLARLRAALGERAGPVLAFRLVCAPEELERRVRRRNNWAQLEWELVRCRELAAALDAAADGGDLGVAVETTSLTVEQAADAIWGLAQTYQWRP